VWIASWSSTSGSGIEGTGGGGWIDRRHGRSAVAQFDRVGGDIQIRFTTTFWNYAYSHPNAKLLFDYARLEAGKHPWSLCERHQAEHIGRHFLMPLRGHVDRGEAV